MSLIFKKCTLDEIDLLIDVSRTSFIDAFEKDNNPDDFKKYITKAFNREQMSSELLNPNSSFYFLIQDDGLFGYVKLNRKDAQKEQFDLKAIELERIYVLKEFQGKRIGEVALSMIIDMAKKANASCLWLGVWEKNTKAITFYENNGFITFDKHPYLIGEDEQYDFMMKLEF